ncbi:MAG: hypothetical protein JSV31_06455 [Desulfobacterales bacterium]|nr:MAG: hypothetical protein JSV31_06455 [Desulfobacterales bacterium]
MTPMDVCDESFVQKGVEVILSQEDRLDVVVNNVGFAMASSIEDDLWNGQ